MGDRYAKTGRKGGARHRGGRGIGKAISLAFAREGAFVGVLDLKDEIAQQAVEAIEAAGGRALGIAGNVARREDVFRAVDALNAASVA